MRANKLAMPVLFATALNALIGRSSSILAAALVSVAVGSPPGDCLLGDL